MASYDEIIKNNCPSGTPENLIIWASNIADLTKPVDVVFCDGSDEEWNNITDLMVAQGSLVRLNDELRPNSFLARSTESDVARVESRTFICTQDPLEAGPTNNWADPLEMRKILYEKFQGCMQGRVMYIIPFSMGPVGGPVSRIGVEITDSPYVVASMRIMTYMGKEAMDLIIQGSDWIPAIHSVGAPLGPGKKDVAWPCNDDKYITHFPETNEIWSYGSGYGGNALLGKKCFALRIASVLAQREGWMAEHMLILRLTRQDNGKSYHVCAAFPSACGKTNLAMLQPTIPGYTVETIGDDIAWMYVDDEGYLRAINPERGFFGVAPGTSYATNPMAMESIARDTIFTNVALTDDGDVWWEGMTDELPDHLIDWKGNDWNSRSGGVAAHPNSRFTAPAANCPIISPLWQDPQGVKIDAILFGGRRTSNIPLVAEQMNSVHGVFIGSAVSSEQTAAAEGTVGSLRHDPFAMLPFCGYNMAKYWQHWLDMSKKIGTRFPHIFQVNWFRKDEEGNYLWPGYGDNSRVLDWIIRRLENEVGYVTGATGLYPRFEDFNLDGLDYPIEENHWNSLFEVDLSKYLEELDDIEIYYQQFGELIPQALREELARLRQHVTILQNEGEGTVSLF